MVNGWYDDDDDNDGNDDDDGWHSSFISTAIISHTDKLLSVVVLAVMVSGVIMPTCLLCDYRIIPSSLSFYWHLVYASDIYGCVLTNSLHILYHYVFPAVSITSLKSSIFYKTTNLGKRPLVRRRGRGGNQFRSTSTGKVGLKANYPRFALSEQRTGEIIDLVHERGREAPLAKVRFEDGSVSFIPAVLGATVGESLHFGLKSKIEKGNVISVQNIPDGTIVCNIEKHFGDGGAIVKSAGTNATIFSHGDDGVTVKLPSGKFTTLNPKNRAMIGTLAGGGASERHFMSAGNKWRSFKAKGKKYPIVRGVAQAAYVHPHGGGRHQHVGQSSTVSRDAPPGAKVGSIAARKTGRARIKERR